MTPKFLAMYIEICRALDRTPTAQEARKYYRWQKEYYENKENSK